MTNVSKHPWLSKRGNVYRVRAPVPQDIIETFGKREITYSLGTKDPAEARRKIDGEAQKIRQQFESHRNQHSVGVPEENAADVSVALSQLVVQHTCEERYQTIVDDDFEWRYQFREDLETIAGDDQHWCDAVNQGLRVRANCLSAQLVPVANISSLFDDLTRAEVLLACVHDLQKHHLDALDFKLSLADLTAHFPIARQSICGLSDPDCRRLARKLLETDRAAYTDILAKDAGRYDAIMAKRARVVVSAVEPSRNKQSGQSGPVLSTLLEAFRMEGQREGLVIKSLNGDNTDLREFVSVAGDKPVRAYSKTDAARFKEVLSRCPANRQSAMYRGLPIGECADLADKHAVTRRLSTSTVNDKLNALSKFFVWADGYLDDVPNPFEGLRIKVKKKRQKMATQRLPFTVEELQRIFDSTIFRGCQSRHGWKHKGELIPRESARFWAPLIALFSGMRLGEIIQLRVADIKTDSDGVQYFDITALTDEEDHEGEKSLKTATSQRQIPVHPFLVQCGLPELIGFRRRKGDMRLLSDYGPSKSDGSWSKNFSGWFNEQFRAHLGLERTVGGRNKINFHSFRHNFEDVVRNFPDVKKEVRDALQGHGENGVSAQYGTGVYRKTLAVAMREVRYDGLDLSHLILEPQKKAGKEFSPIANHALA